MLYKSGENLFSGALEFISNSNEVTLFSAYIKTEQLKKLDSLKKINRIIVRWEIRDLHQGASDLDLYKYCTENNIALFRNTRIHLKCLLNDKDQVFSGSANISARGIGEKDDFFNYELNSISNKIEFVDNVYLDRIISESELVTDELYNKLKSVVERLEKFEKQDEQYKELEINSEKKEDDYFLISELPAYNEIDQLDLNEDEIIESKLLELMPAAFAVVKETSRRLAENGQLKVLANENDRLVASIKDVVTIDGDYAIDIQSG